MPTKDKQTKHVYVTINNLWGYSDEVFDIVLDHLSSLLISTTMMPDELHEGLPQTCEAVMEVYNPKFHESLDDFATLCDMENRYFETMDHAKSLLDIILSDNPELTGMYRGNIQDVCILKLTGPWALMQITITPIGGW